MFWSKIKKEQSQIIKQDHNPEDDIIDKAISTDTLVSLLSDSEDIIFNHIIVNHDMNVKLTVVFVDGMVDSLQLDNDILKPLIQEKALSFVQDEKELINRILLGSVYHSHRMRCDTLSECIDRLFTGSVLLVFDDTHTAIAFESKGYEKRAITEPTNHHDQDKESYIRRSKN
jgi:spore germination protein KA